MTQTGRIRMTQRLTMMVVVLVVFLGSAFLVFGANAEETVDYLQERNGVYYKVNEKKGFTGRYLKFYWNGQKAGEFRTVNGKIEGWYMHWYSTGQRKAAGKFKNGKIEGAMGTWYENGQEKSIATYYDNGKLQTMKKYHKDGRIESFKGYDENGKLIVDE
jgi:antitoxin component YwqK of YwqJK toxin-antitoxin module